MAGRNTKVASKPPLLGCHMPSWLSRKIYIYIYKALRSWQELCPDRDLRMLLIAAYRLLWTLCFVWAHFCSYQTTILRTIFDVQWELQIGCRGYLLQLVESGKFMTWVVLTSKAHFLRGSCCDFSLWIVKKLTGLQVVLSVSHFGHHIAQRWSNTECCRIFELLLRSKIPSRSDNVSITFFLEIDKTKLSTKKDARLNSYLLTLQNKNSWIDKLIMTEQ